MWIMLEYACPECGERLESLELRSEPADTLPHCGTQAPRVPSSVRGHSKIGEVTRGKSEERPPGAMNTELLADGMPRSEWKKLRRQGRQDWLREGIVDKKVYV